MFFLLQEEPPVEDEDPQTVLRNNILQSEYSKTCLKWPLKNRKNKGLQDKW